MGKWEEAKKTCLERDKGKCRRCPKRAVDVHHRKPRKMGGTKNEDIAYGLDNLVSLCRDCHNYVHHNPRESYELGWLVHSWDDPGKVSVLSPGGLTGHPGACGIF